MSIDLDYFGMNYTDIRTIFDNSIVPPKDPSHMSRPKKPTLTILGGQPGSGKSTFIHSQDLLNSDERTIIVNQDDMPHFIPNFTEKFQNNPTRAMLHAEPITQIWQYSLFDHAMAQKANVIYEMRDPYHLPAALTVAKIAGFDTKLSILSTNQIESQIASYEKFERILQSNVCTTNIYNENDYQRHAYSWHNAILGVEVEKAVDHLSVIRRDGAILYENALNQDNNWQKDLAGYEVLVLEQHRSLSPYESRDLNQRANNLINSEVIIESHYFDKPTFISSMRNHIAHIDSEASQFELLKDSPHNTLTAGKEWLENFRQTIDRQSGFSNQIVENAYIHNHVGDRVERFIDRVENHVSTRINEQIQQRNAQLPKQMDHDQYKGLSL